MQWGKTLLLAGRNMVFTGYGLRRVVPLKTALGGYVEPEQVARQQRGLGGKTQHNISANRVPIS